MIDLDRNSTDSEIIDWLRFPLAVIVVAIHSVCSYNSKDISYFIHNEIILRIGGLAVPVFSFLSGYLLFSKYNRFGRREYKILLKNKFYSLLLPYILWNAMMFYAMWISGRTEYDYSPYNLYRIFWAYSPAVHVESILGYDFLDYSAPVIKPLWFIRDLFMIVLISPVIWWISILSGKWSLLLWVFPYILSIGIPLDMFGIISLCFVSLGASFAIHGISLNIFCKKYWKFIFSLFVILSTVEYFSILSDPYGILSRVNTVLGVLSVLCIARIAVLYGKSKETMIKLGEMAFFIYVTHEFIGIRSVHHIAEALCDIEGWGGTAGLLVDIILRVAICIGLYNLLKRLYPNTLNILSGGRVNKRKIRNMSLG